MLFDSTVRKELGRSFAATLVVILTIVITMLLIRTLGAAAAGSVDAQDVVLLLGYSALGYMPIMLSLSLFVAVILVLGRMYRDSEMAVWFSSGLPLRRFLRPVLWSALPVLVLVAATVGWIWPWVNTQSAELRDRYQQRSDLSRVTPGIFQTSADGQRIFFIERDRPDSLSARNVFILSQSPQAESVTSAKSGQIQWEGEERYLVLDKGQRAEFRTDLGEHTVAEFDTYRVRVDDSRARRDYTKVPKALSVGQLLAEPTAAHQAELVWRAGMAWAALNLLLLGVGLSATHPRKPSNWNLILALLTFVVYANLVNLSQSWVATSKLTAPTALFSVHVTVGLLALALLAWRDGGATVLWRWWPRRRS